MRIGRYYEPPAPEPEPDPAIANKEDGSADGPPVHPASAPVPVDRAAPALEVARDDLQGEKAEPAHHEGVWSDGKSERSPDDQALDLSAGDQEEENADLLPVLPTSAPVPVDRAAPVLEVPSNDLQEEERTPVRPDGNRLAAAPRSWPRGKPRQAHAGVPQIVPPEPVPVLAPRDLPLPKVAPKDLQEGVKQFDQGDSGKPKSEPTASPKKLHKTNAEIKEEIERLRREADAQQRQAIVARLASDDDQFEHPRRRAARAAGKKYDPVVADIKDALIRIAQRKETRERRKKWAEHNKKGKAETVAEVVAEAVAKADSAVAAGKLRRVKVLQENTPKVWKDYNYARWNKALARESGPRVLHPAIVPANVTHVSKRADRIDLLPEAETPFMGHKAMSRGIMNRLSPLIKKEHAVAHFVISAKGDVSAEDFRAVARRCMARLGIDPWQQHCELFQHHDGGQAHCHLVVERSRRDGGVWRPLLGVDRVLALEASLMAQESGVPWDQRMIARSKESGNAAALAAAGKLAGEIIYHDHVERIAWQGPEADARVLADPLACLDHGMAQMILKMTAMRDAEKCPKYASTG